MRLYAVLGLFILLSGFVGLTDSQSTAERSGYPDVPHFLPVEREAKLAIVGTYSMTPFTFDISDDGSQNNIRAKGGTYIESFSVDIRETQKRDSVHVRLVERTFMQRSYCLLVNGKTNYEANGRLLASLEEATEAFEGSPRLTLYSRLVFPEHNILSITYKFVLPSSYENIGLYNSSGLHSFKKNNVPAQFTMKDEDCYLTFVRRDSSDTFGIFLLPLSAEVRKWYTDDYQIVQHHTRIVRLSNATNGKLVVTVLTDSVEAETGETVDQYFKVVAFQNTHNKIADYVTSSLMNYYGRYFPSEGYTTHWYGTKDGLNTVHKDGFTWGFVTYAKPFMETYRHWNPDSLHSYFGEEMTRHMNYFFERISNYGLLPYTILPKTLVDQTKEKGKLQTDFMFSQAGVGDVDFASKFLPTLPNDEANGLYMKLDRLKKLFDPNEKMSWTTVMPNGAYWFEYSNLWKTEGYLNTIINTHVTAFRIAVHMRELAKRLDKTDDVKFWDEVVRKGTDGLLWFIQDAKNWGKGESGKTELNYKVGAPPHGTYHEGIVDELTYLHNQGLLDYRDDEIMSALKYTNN